MSTNDLALFPLAAVLFPGGTLDLRIFEPRYLDLVRDCARNDSAFGVCLILSGHETGAAAVPAAVGTLARIVDFDSLPDGLLGIRVRGGERFRVGATRVRDNGLVLGSARLWPAEPRVALPPEYALLASILERLLERIGGEPARAERALYDDASWVGFRLAEHLPLARTEQQELLQLTDPLERLAWLTRELPRFQPD
ncbi:MAG: peptidase S16 [Xanthomonadales bacterium]|nr:peptidase S16 [Xanthomonadales bacterium]MDL1869003.1 peptidase S16 [Gammaproteobacteria bacterium PRO6]